MAVQDILVRFGTEFKDGGVKQAIRSFRLMEHSLNAVQFAAKLAFEVIARRAAAAARGVLGLAAAVKALDSIGEVSAKRAVEFGDSLGIAATEAEKLIDLLDRQGRKTEDFIQLLNREKIALGDAANEVDVLNAALAKIGIAEADLKNVEVNIEAVQTAARPDPNILAEWKDIAGDLGILIAAQVQPVEEAVAKASNAVGQFAQNTINQFLGNVEGSPDDSFNWFERLVGLDDKARNQTIAQLEHTIDTIEEETETRMGGIWSRLSEIRGAAEILQRKKAITEMTRAVEATRRAGHDMGGVWSRLADHAIAQNLRMANSAEAQAERARRAWTRAISIGTGQTGNPAAQASIGGLGLEGETTAFDSALPQIRADRAERGLQINAPSVSEDLNANFPEGVL